MKPPSNDDHLTRSPGSPRSQTSAREGPESGEGHKNKSFPIRLNADEKRRYKVLAAETDTHMADAARRGLEVWEKMGGRLLYPIRVLGYIPGGTECGVRPLEDCFVNVDREFAEMVEEDDYFLIVNGNSMCSGKEDSIESGEYALFRPGRDACGKIAHIEWEDASGEHVCTLKKFQCGEDDVVTLKPANPDYEPIIKRRSEVSVRGVFVRKWSPRSS